MGAPSFALCTVLVQVRRSRRDITSSVHCPRGVHVTRRHQPAAVLTWAGLTCPGHYSYFSRVAPSRKVSTEECPQHTFPSPSNIYLHVELQREITLYTTQQAASRGRNEQSCLDCCAALKYGNCRGPLRFRLLQEFVRASLQAVVAQPDGSVRAHHMPHDQLPSSVSSEPLWHLPLETCLMMPCSVACSEPPGRWT